MKATSSLASEASGPVIPTPKPTRRELKNPTASFSLQVYIIGVVQQCIACCTLYRFSCVAMVYTARCSRGRWAVVHAKRCVWHRRPKLEL